MGGVTAPPGTPNFRGPNFREAAASFQQGQRREAQGFEGADLGRESRNDAVLLRTAFQPESSLDCVAPSRRFAIASGPARAQWRVGHAKKSSLPDSCARRSTHAGAVAGFLEIIRQKSKIKILGFCEYMHIYMAARHLIG